MMITDYTSSIGGARCVWHKSCPARLARSVHFNALSLNHDSIGSVQLSPGVHGTNRVNTKKRYPDGVACVKELPLDFSSLFAQAAYSTLTFAICSQWFMATAASERSEIPAEFHKSIQLLSPPTNSF